MPVSKMYLPTNIISPYYKPFYGKSCSLGQNIKLLFQDYEHLPFATSEKEHNKCDLVN